MTEWILSSSILILTVILVRRLFRDKMRPTVQYALWALVLVRLLVPFSVFQSPISAEGLLTEVQKLPPVQNVTDSLSTPNISIEDAYDQAVEDFLQSGQEVEQTKPDFSAPGYVPQTPLEEHTQEILELSAPVFTLEQIALWVWISGMAITALIFLLSNLKFRRYLRTHRQLLERHPAGLPVYVCSGLDTPCLFGTVKPAIYLLPTEAEDEAKRHHILTHELTHYCHGDHIWAALRCLCLVLHWYNPLVWKAAILSRRDGELACDEATIRKLGEDQRISYGVTLIEMTCAKQAGAGLMNTATTMTGSMSAIKERVTMIAKKPKKSIVALIAAVLIAAAAAVICFSTLGNIPALSAEKRAQLEQAWHEYYPDDPFYDPKVNKEGIRYYGTYTDNEGLEYDLLFVSYTINQDGFRSEDYSNIPVDIVLDGKHFIHSSPFKLLLRSKSKYSDSIFFADWIGMYNRPSSEMSRADKKVISQVYKIHTAYETRLYGPFRTNTEVVSDSDAPKQAKAAYYTYYSGTIGGGLVHCYGRIGGYNIISTSGLWVTDMPTVIGNEQFYYYTDLSFFAYLDGEFVELEKLYEQGAFSDAALAELAQKHQEYWENTKKQREDALENVKG